MRRWGLAGCSEQEHVSLCGAECEQRVQIGSLSGLAAFASTSLQREQAQGYSAGCGVNRVVRQIALQQQ